MTYFAVPAIVLMAAAGCSADDPPAAQRERPTIDVATVAANTTAFQKEFLADGVVTFAEYEKATLQAIECTRQAGLSVDGPYARDQKDHRFLDYSYGGPNLPGETDEAASERIGHAGETCDIEYRRDVERVWTFQNLLSPKDRQEMKPRLIDCLTAAGVKIDRDATEEEVVKATAEASGNKAVDACREEFGDFYVIGVK